ncbi:MAG: trehalose-6-phosphate synthase [Acidimicrobiia bacterium]
MIVVSHRGPYGFSVGDHDALVPARGPGGLAATLHQLATSSDALSDATCVSAALSDGDRAASQRIRGGDPLPDLGTRVHFVEIDPELHRLHYDVVSNEVLWFVFHGIFDLPRRPTFDATFRTAWNAYVAVNEQFADAVTQLAPEDDTVLVQDYSLALVPGMLGTARPDLRVAYFAHTPFCEPDGLRVLPDHVAFALCESLAAHPSGFHTERWALNFEASARAVLGTDATIAPTFAAPLGPDPDAIATIAASPAVDADVAELDALVDGRKLIFRSDRIDLTKNIARGFLAYDTLLDEHPEWRERVIFVAMLNSSRATVPEYIAYRKEVEEAATRVNERWATPSWTPLVVDTRDDYEQTVAGFRRYDVMLVNPVKDGLNLVAKEGPLVNERDGVVCLSPEAGSYEELAPAVLPVHPFDVVQHADALHRALSMDDGVRVAMADRLRLLAARRTPEIWLADLVAHAR